MWTVRSLCTAILTACKLSSPCIERAAWAACAEGAVPPRLRRAVTVPGTKAGHGSAGGLGLPKPRPLAARRAGDPPLPPQKHKRPEEGEFFRPGRPPRQPRTACPPVRRAQVVGCGEIWCALSGRLHKRCPAERTKIQSVPVPARKNRHGTGPNPRHRAAAADAGTGRPSDRPPRPGPWR